MSVDEDKISRILCELASALGTTPDAVTVKINAPVVESEVTRWAREHTRESFPPVDEEFAGYINELIEVSHGMAVVCGWHEVGEIDVPKMIALIHSEVSEALEGDRKNMMDEKLTHRSALEVELADAIIRIFDLAGRVGLDLGGAYVEKSRFNMIRADHKKEVRQAAGGKKY